MIRSVTTLKDRLNEDVKTALRGGDKERLSVLRMATAAVKQREVDSREALDDAGVTAVLEKMVKQGHEAIDQFKIGRRDDLANKEQFEVDVLKAYLPEPLSESELESLIDAAIEATGATSMRDMGGVMAQVKEQAAGRADMREVSNHVRARLGG